MKTVRTHSALGGYALPVQGYVGDSFIHAITLGREFVVAVPGSRRALRLGPVASSAFLRVAPTGILRGDLALPSDADERRLLEALAGFGIIRRRWDLDDAAAPSVGIIVPAHERPAAVARCVSALCRLRYPQDRMVVLVVDDGSRDETGLAAKQAGAQVLRLPRNAGPGAARNAGAQEVARDVEFLAFVDSDCVADPDWLRRLVVELADHRVAACAGRAVSRGEDSPVERYEQVRSPIDLGTRRADLDRTGPFFYVPAANLVVRRRLFDRIGGFRVALRVGEDVDLCQRLLEAGGRIRYVPEATVVHVDRPTIRGFVTRRFGYGTSEPVLRRLHPASRRRLPVPLLPVAVISLALHLARRPTARRAAAATLLLGLQAAVTRSGSIARRDVIGRFAGAARADGYLAQILLRQIARYYAPWTFAIGIALRSQRLRRFGAGAMLTIGAWDYLTLRPQLDPLRFLSLRALDDLAYAAGVLAGAWREGNPAAVIGGVRVWHGYPSKRIRSMRSAPNSRRTKAARDADPLLVGSLIGRAVMLSGARSGAARQIDAASDPPTPSNRMPGAP
jgi:mycofactocin system glycosyltransferase